MSRSIHYLVAAAAMMLMLAGCGRKDTADTRAKASISYYTHDGVLNYTDYLHPNGELKEKVYYDDEGNISNRVSYTYDEAFRLIKVEDSIDASIEVYEYDADGRQVLQYTEDFTGRSEITSTYGEDGRLRIDSSKLSDQVTVARLDEAGNEIEVWLINSERDTVGHSQSTFNDRDLEIENKYWVNEQLRRHRKRSYNEEDKVTEEYWYNEDGKMRMSYVNEYDDFGRLVLTARYTDGKEDFRLEYAYGDNERTCTTYIPNVRTKTTREVYTYYDGVKAAD